MIRRVAVIGLPGSGKSTVAEAFGARGLKVVSYDQMKWANDESPASLGELKSRLVDLGDGWVLDGCTDETWEWVLHQTDTVIWLDYSLALTLARLLRRQVRRYLNRRTSLRPMPLKRVIGWEPSHRSLKRMIWRVVTRRRRYEEALERLAGDSRLVRIRKRHQLGEFMREEGLLSQRAVAGRAG